MSDNDTDKLHRLVREAAETLQPEYNPAHWERMKGKLAPVDTSLKSGGNRYGLFKWTILFLAGSALLWFTIQRFAKSSPESASETAIHVSPLPGTTAEAAETTSRSGMPAVTADTAIGTVPSGPEQNQPAISRARKVSTSPIASLSGPAVQALPVPDASPIQIPIPDASPQNFVAGEIRSQLVNHFIGPDSTTFRVFSRHQRLWRNVAVTADFTSSMYPYATQVYTWLHRNRHNQAIKGVVLFTDCDSLGHETGTGSLPGKMYVSQSRALADIFPLMLEAAGNTECNLDEAENDLEAVLRTQAAFPDVREIILIADNSSAVKDMHLLPQIRKPVRVIVCGPSLLPGLGIQPDYLTIARQTGGSLHTMEDDIPAATPIANRTWIKVGDTYYKYQARKNRFVATERTQRPIRIWFLDF